MKFSKCFNKYIFLKILHSMGMKKGSIHNEDIAEEDITNNMEENVTVYQPEEADEDTFSCEEEAYVSIDYINLEWPSQTIDILNENNFIVGTNPTEGESKIMSFNLENYHDKHFSRTTTLPLNRIRCGNQIYGVSDNSFTIFNDKLDSIYSHSLETGVSYGLCPADDTAYFASLTGEVFKCYENGIDSFKLHNSSVESLCYHNNILFSASTDNTIKITDCRSRDNVFTGKYSCDINAIDYNKDNRIVFGDDKGILRIIDIRSTKNETVIDWHKTSISSVRWKDNDVFVSSSDHQVCIFDMSLEEDWSYEKYLLFVHQGQKYYKDVCLTRNDEIIVTSIDGLCLFKPISFSN